MMRLAILLFLVAPAFQAGAEDHRGTHCADTEEVIFSCPVGSKVVSLCASPGLDSSSGFMQYRFGPVGDIELKYPKGKKHPFNYFTMFGSGFSRGYIAHLNFSVGEYTYVVYEQLVGAFVDGRPEGHERYAGVKVTRGGKVVTDFACSNTESARLPGTFEGIFRDGGGYQYWWFHEA